MANTCHQMCVDSFECAPRVAVDTWLRTYAERLDLSGSSFWSATLNKQASSRTSSPITYQKYGVKVKKLFSDNGGEYIADDLVLFCERNGIETLHTSAHSLEQTGICERYNWMLVEALRSVLLTSRMARTLIGVSLLCLLLLYKITYRTSPMEAAFGTVPKAFGSEPSAVAAILCWT